MKKILEFGGVAAGVVLVAFGIAAIERNPVKQPLATQNILGVGQHVLRDVDAEYLAIAVDHPSAFAIRHTCGTRGMRDVGEDNVLRTLLSNPVNQCRGG